MTDLEELHRTNAVRAASFLRRHGYEVEQLIFGCACGKPHLFVRPVNPVEGLVGQRTTLQDVDGKTTTAGQARLHNCLVQWRLN